MAIKILATTTCFRLDIDGTYQLPFMTLCNLKEKREQMFYSEDFVSMVGRAKAYHGFVKYDFAFAEIPFKSGVIFTQNRTLKAIHNSAGFYSDYLKDFFRFLWFVKDNSIGVHEVVAFGESPIPAVSIFSYDAMISNCIGRYEDVTFNEQELKETENILNLFYQNCSAYEFKNNDRIFEDLDISVDDIIDITSSTAHQYNDFNRIERAMSFLNTARGIDFLPYKISMYMPIFETLFIENNQDNFEVTHKVSERVAFYAIDSDSGVKDVGAETKKVFKFVKSAYNIRSRYLHGSKFSDEHIEESKLIKLAREIDNITRAILIKIITRDYDTFKNGRLGEFLGNLVFQPTPPATETDDEISGLP